MKLYMVRHGESEANLDYNILKTKRDEDVELSPKGYQDALEAGKKLKAILSDEHEHAVYMVSPWVRACQTWCIINGVLGGLHSATETDLVAEHFMNLVNHPANWEIFKKYEASNWNVKEFLDVRYDGAESIRDVQERAETLVRQLKYNAMEYGQHTVVCMCHGQFIKQVTCLVKNLDPDTVVHPTNGEIVELDL